MTESEALANKLFALNQGYYNLFLALGAFAGIYFFMAGHTIRGTTLIGFSTGSMAAASMVLAFSAPNLKKAAGKQGLFPWLTLTCMLF